MPLAAIILGVIIITLAFRGTEHQFAQQLGKDFASDDSNFLAWAAAVLAIGAVGYSKTLRPISTVGLALVIVALVLSRGGLFERLQAVVIDPPAPSPRVPLSAYGSPPGAGAAAGAGGGASGGGSKKSGAMSALGIVAEVAGVVAAPYTGGASLVAATALNAAMSQVGQET